MLTTLLKEYTKEEHASLEKKLISVLKKIRIPSDYLKVLHLFYSYYDGLEKNITQFLDKELLPDYSKRRKSKSILEDISIIDSSARIADCPTLPEINNSYAALGALYVIEGSTLGGQIISKMISSKLNLSDNAGLTFFEGYGSQTMQMWETFKSRINDLTLLDQQKEELLSAAKETFVKFEEWLDRNSE